MHKSTLRNYIGLLSLLFLAVVGHSAVKETYGIFSQSLKVGGSTVAGSDAALEVQSTTKGVLFSPMTAVQRNAIGTPRTGLMVYNTDTSQYNYYNGTSWGILSGFANPMTTAGDLIVGGGSGSPGRLGIGATDTALVSNGSAASWAKLLNANIDTAAAIAHSKMAALTASRVLVSDGSGVVSASSVTSTTLGYLDIGSSLTTLLAAKAPLANPTFTGVVKVDDGSVSAPSYTFSNETNTGLYRKAASTLGFSVAGTEGIDVVNIGSGLVNVGFGQAANGTAYVPFVFTRSQNSDVYAQFNNPSTGNASSINFQLVPGTASGRGLLLSAYGDTYNTNTFLNQKTSLHSDFNMLSLVLGSDYSGGDIEFTIGTPSTAHQYLNVSTTAVAAKNGAVLSVDGSSSGTVTIKAQAAAGTYNFNLPTSAGTSGQALLSGGGGSTAMTFGTLGVGAGGTGLTSFSSGDILYATGATTLAALPKGADGTILTLASGLPSWVSLGSGLAVSQQNLLVNAEFRFAQAQTPGTLTTLTDGGYGADQWYMLDSNGGSTSQYARAAGESAGSTYTQFIGQFRQVNASAKQIMVCQPLTNAKTLSMRGKSVTFAYYARTDSTEITTLRTCIGEWTGTVDSITKDVVSSWGATPTWIGNFACNNTPADQTISSTWAQLSTTATISTSANNVIVCVWTPNTEAQNDDFYLSQTQLVEGSAALSWGIVRKTSLADYIEAAHFYEKSYDVDTIPASSTLTGMLMFTGNGNTASNVRGTAYFKSTKFKSPTMSFWDAVGTASNYTSWNGGNTQTNGRTASASWVATSLNSISFNGSVADLSYGVHWAADSRL
jgi:hypothetical protein